MSSIWTKSLLALAAVWLIAGSAIWYVHSGKPTPEKLMTYVEKHPLEGRPPEERTERIEDVAEQLNGLDYEERQNLRAEGKLDDFFKALTPAEQAAFLDRTLPEGFKQMMESLNTMEPRKRKRLVERALKDMRDQEGGGIPTAATQQLDANGQKIISQGLKSFYSEAAPETKLDLSPLIEQMQRNLQQGFR